ncbi:tigger transposable element-derived protein 6-like [Chelonus insularis]|uniref:tigger transposable element-derived protein 6-like n=1 Tax=Chelonus insularis TaxID=460826 RepID=UPI00158960B0|nr:tigger transposable element-derived protein 6-like [Chelonus insularis]
MSKRKIKVLSLSDKLKIVNAFESEKSRNGIQKEFNLPESTYYKIIKSKQSIKSECSNGHGNIKRTRVSEFPNIEKCLLEWIKQTLDKNIPIDGPLLKEKSEEFATKLGIQNFSASNGWLEGFKRRHDIDFKKAAGESKSVDQGVCNHWIEDLPNLLERYEPDDIYNADETALFLKCLPDKTFTFKGEKFHGGKQSKLPLLIIGNSKRPRCFKGVKTLPVDDANNTKAWMTKILFKDWLKKVDEQMKINRKKILLFIENCAAHTDLPTLSNVKVMFSPANTTSKLQPLDQGIIHTFKRFYRREVAKHILTSLEENRSPDINVLLAMEIARKAWYSVSDVTVKNCFKKAGFWKSTDV